MKYSSTSPFPDLTDAQKKRSAGHVINGYLYQFERSIIQILEAESSGQVRLEGIEDIDLWDEGGATAIQVKYLTSKKYSSPKSVAKPVFEMFKSYCDGHDINYRLFAHFGEGGQIPRKLTPFQLNECFSSQEVDQARLDSLKGFIPGFSEKLTLVSGDSISTQRNHVVRLLSDVLTCSPSEANDIHRMRAVQRVQEISSCKGENQRMITKKNFVEFLNVRPILYSRWHREIVGEDKFASTLGRSLKNSNFFHLNEDRGIFLSLSSNDTSVAAELLEELSSDITRPKRPTTVKPWTVIVEADDQVRIDLKKELLSRNIIFNDGYEEIEFSAYHFKKGPIYNTKMGGPVISDWSYDLKILSTSSIDAMKSFDSDWKLKKLLVVGNRHEWCNSVSHNNPVYVELGIGGVLKAVRKGMK